MNRFEIAPARRAMVGAFAVAAALVASGCAPEAPATPGTTTAAPTTTAVPCGTYTGAAASASITTPTSTVGGTVRLTGSNWLHPSGGGSTIAVKIDEGAYSRQPGDLVHANATVWALVEVDCTGSFSVDIQLPTASNSTPTFSAGSHSLRLLTGSIKPNDAIRTVLTNSFTVS